MRRMRRSLVGGLLILALAALPTAPAAAGNRVERPHVFRSTGANFNGECDLSGFPIVMCPYEGTTSGVGTHIGSTSGAYTGMVTLDFSKVCVGVNGAKGTPILSAATSVLVAANGDELHSRSESTGCFVDFGVGTRYVGTETIVGGTGRFESATGVLATTLYLVADDPSGSTSSYVDERVGTIAY